MKNCIHNEELTTSKRRNAELKRRIANDKCRTSKQIILKWQTMT
jgi:hypothetical protein